MPTVRGRRRTRAVLVVGLAAAALVMLSLLGLVGPPPGQQLLYGLLAIPRPARVALAGLATGARGSTVYFNPLAGARAAITLDDAPSRDPASFNALLELLSRLELKVTFGVIAAHADSPAGAEMLAQAVAEGHQLINHAGQDSPSTGMEQGQFERAITGCQRLIDAAQPGGALWFRPASGLMGSTMRRVIDRLRYRAVMGDCYSADAQIEDPPFHAGLLSRCVQGGSVVILHCPEPGHRSQTLRVIPPLVESLRARGIALVKLDELFRNHTAL